MSEQEKTEWADVDALIREQMQREDLTAEDVLNLTLARRFNNCSDSSLRGTAVQQPQFNFWNRR